MWKVLIADDEKKVGLLIKKLIDWDNLNLELLDIVQDGKNALEVILKKKPDIVITDIRMPVISGLDLIKQVISLNLQVRFIVISGYRYFEYAQAALKYGVENYLLKPVDEVELNQQLGKICMELQELQQETVKIEALENRYNNSKHILHRELLNDFIENKENRLISDVNKEYGVRLGRGYFRAFCLKADRNLKIEKSEQQEKVLMQRLTKKIDRGFENIAIDIVISVQNDMRILVLLNYKEELRSTVNEKINEVFLQCKEYMEEFENYEVTVGVSKDTLDFSKINIILEMAKEAINCRIFDGTGIRIENYSENKNRAFKGTDVLEIYKEDIMKAFQILDCDYAGNIIFNCFKLAEEKNIMACEYLQLSKGIILLYQNEIKELLQEDIGEFPLKLLEKENNCKTVDMLKNCMIREIKDNMITLIRKREERERKPVLEIIEYMKENYSQKVSLEQVAEKSGFNPNYFSEIFKKETGKNFSVYLQEIRMEAAKQMLRDGKDTVYDIANKVGYKDPKYFSQQFTKIVGTKPNEYRKLYA